MVNNRDYADLMFELTLTLTLTLTPTIRVKLVQTLNLHNPAYM